MAPETNAEILQATKALRRDAMEQQVRTSYRMRWLSRFVIRLCRWIEKQATINLEDGEP